jgi:hypothetical protein
VKTEKYEVRNRWTNAVQFTAEITCAPDAPMSVKLGLAVRWGVENKADLRGAYLRGTNLSDANLSGADLRGAYLRGANLRGANLRGADLSGAYLSGAYLSGADLSGADLSGEKVIRTFASLDRSDGYQFRAFALEAGGVKIQAGCRWFTPEEYRAHVAAKYPDTDRAAETLLIIGFIEARALQTGATNQPAKVGI